MMSLIVNSRFNRSFFSTMLVATIIFFIFIVLVSISGVIPLNLQEIFFCLGLMFPLWVFGIIIVFFTARNYRKQLPEVSDQNSIGLSNFARFGYAYLDALDKGLIHPQVHVETGYDPGALQLERNPWPLSILQFLLSLLFSAGTMVAIIVFA